MTTHQNSNKYTKMEEEFARQDVILDEISGAVDSLKDVALDINHQLTDHNQLIKDLTDHVEDTDANVRRVTTRVTLLSRAKGSCGFIALVLAIITIIIIVILVILYSGAVN